jgi:hypothetical protein
LKALDYIVMIGVERDNFYLIFVGTNVGELFNKLCSLFLSLFDNFSQFKNSSRSPLALGLSLS